MAKKLGPELLVPLVVVALFGLLNVFELFSIIDNRIYDFFLHLKGDVRENHSILIIDVDDTAISNVGEWPWSRSVMADGLITMKEFDAANAVFDIQYLNPSPLGVDAPYLKRQIPLVFNDQFSSLRNNIVDLFQAIRSGSISVADSREYVQQLAGQTDDSQKVLLGKVQAIARDNDSYLGNAAWFFEHAFFTVNYRDQETKVPTDYERWVVDHESLKNVVLKGTYGHPAVGLEPAIEPILTKAAGSGFPRVFVDPDGVRRRITLIVSHGGKFFGQLAFAPLVDYLGDPEIDLYTNKIVLKGAKAPGYAPRDIAIPLTSDGDLLLNWPKKGFATSYRQISYYSLVRYQEQEDELLALLHGMSDANYLSFYPSGATFFQPYDQAETVKQQVLAGGSRDSTSTYRDLRARFFDDVGRFLDSNAEKQILAQIDQALAKRGITKADREQFTSIRDDVVSKFKDTQTLYSALMESRRDLSGALKGSFCFIGMNATSSTDFGVNPFDHQYANVGTHATVANSILNAAFVQDAPAWYSTVLSVILGLGLFLTIRRRTPLQSILIGIGFIVVFLCATIVLFVLTGIYLAVTAPLLALLFVFVILTIFRFLSEAREKSYIRNAFGRYLSGDVINELLADPEKLSLGGQQKELTAIFTDVKGFSTISEQMSPSDLVSLLNTYLTEMSDIILDERGTIDKYEGDAIISFFGAPVSYTDHPSRACAAAVRMKAAESRLNERFAAEGTSPGPLLTRIGINTGEMVVGNMGTINKMDYTIMGNSVNLAARLEGVNKQYGTWILVSEATRNGCSDNFLFRKLDRVRVVGIQQPVRLYELVGDRGSADSARIETMDRFHRALDLFEGKDWARAKAGFEAILKDFPEDGPAKAYLKRCEEYTKTPPAATWDGVFNLSVK